MIDTVIYTRSPVLTIMNRLQAADIDTARFVGLPLDMFATPAGRRRMRLS